MIELDTFLSAIRRDFPLLEAEQLGRELYGATRFSPFEYIDTKETALSRLLADLLDPRGSHGQGPVFLNSFLTSIGLSQVSPWQPNVSVRCEDRTGDGGRIDIVVTTDDAIIGIENKPFAAEGDRQLERYVSELKARPGSQPIRRLVYLSQNAPENDDPLITHVKFVGPGPEPWLATALENASRNVKAERVLRFVMELCSWLNKTFGAPSMVNELTTYTEYALRRYGESAENRKAIGLILTTTSRLHTEVLDEIGTGIESELRSSFDDIEVVGLPLSRSLAQRWGGPTFRRPSWPTNVYVQIAADQLTYSKISYGVVGLSADAPDASRFPTSVAPAFEIVRTRLSNVVPGGKHTSWWPWYRVHPTSIWSSEWVGRLLVESGGAPTSHREIRTMIDELLEVARAVDTVSA